MTVDTRTVSKYTFFVVWAAATGIIGESLVADALKGDPLGAIIVFLIVAAAAILVGFIGSDVWHWIEHRAWPPQKD